MTEQGEMIRFKYGLPEITVSSLSLYTGAILEANLLPPPEPKESWRRIMDELSVISCDLYRGYVRENKDFVPYFRSATPEQELGKLPLVHVRRNVARLAASSRCAPFRGFCPTQNRLMLPPAGCRYGAAKVVEDGKQSELEAMCRDWPFFSTRLGMLEMVFAKADLWLAEYYDQRPVDKALWPLGKRVTQSARRRHQSGAGDCQRFSPDGRSAVDCRVYSATEYLHRPAERIAGRVAAPLPPQKEGRTRSASSRR